MIMNNVSVMKIVSSKSSGSDATMLVDAWINRFSLGFKFLRGSVNQASPTSQTSLRALVSALIILVLALQPPLCTATTASASTATAGGEYDSLPYVYFTPLSEQRQPATHSLRRRSGGFLHGTQSDDNKDDRMRSQVEEKQFLRRSLLGEDISFSLFSSPISGEDLPLSSFSYAEPSAQPQTIEPTIEPSVQPTRIPTDSPQTFVPTVEPSDEPTRSPTVQPSLQPTQSPTHPPQTFEPTVEPSVQLTRTPTHPPQTSVPSIEPSVQPTRSPTAQPSVYLTPSPTYPPQTIKPTVEPSVRQTRVPTANPTRTPSWNPTLSLPSTSPPTASPTPVSCPSAPSGRGICSVEDDSHQNSDICKDGFVCAGSGLNWELASDSTFSSSTLFSGSLDCTVQNSDPNGEPVISIFVVEEQEKTGFSFIVSNSTWCITGVNLKAGGGNNGNFCDFSADPVLSGDTTGTLYSFNPNNGRCSDISHIDICVSTNCS